MIKKMLQCPNETFARLFYNVSTSFLLLLIVFHLTSILLAKIFTFFGGNPFRNQDAYEFNAFSDEETDEENVYYGPKSMEELSIDGGRYDTLVTTPYDEPVDGESSEEATSSCSTPVIKSSDDDDEEEEEEDEILARDTDSSFYESEANEDDPTSRFVADNLEPKSKTHEGHINPIIIFLAMIANFFVDRIAFWPSVINIPYRSYSIFLTFFS